MVGERRGGGGGIMFNIDVLFLTFPSMSLH